MKTCAFSRLILLPLASLAVMTMTPFSLHAQNAAKPAASPGKEARILKISASRLSEALEILNEQFPGWNFTCEPEIAHLKIKEILLHAPPANDAPFVDADAAALAINRAADMVDFRPPDEKNPSDRNFLFYLSVGDPADKRVKTGVEAFSLKDVEIEGLRYEEVADKRKQRMNQIRRMVSSTIDSIRVQGLLPIGEEPAFQFYPEANVLVAIGSRDSIEVARKIINAVNEAPLNVPLGSQPAATGKSGGAPAPSASPSPVLTR